MLKGVVLNDGKGKFFLLILQFCIQIDEEARSKTFRTYNTELNFEIMRFHDLVLLMERFIG